VLDDPATPTASPIVVRSVGDLVDVVTRMSAAGHWPWYRGHVAADWDVLPSIWRGYGPMDERNFTNRSAPVPRSATRQPLPTTPTRRG
jgi:hypothetical protein